MTRRIKLSGKTRTVTTDGITSADEAPDPLPVIVMYGSPVTGFTHYGPFTSHEEAICWAEEELRSDSWWIALLMKP